MTEHWNPEDHRPTDPTAALAEMAKQNAALAEQVADLLDALEAALPELGRAATAEARANKAPTGLPPRTAARERWEHARAAIAKARGE